MLRVLLTIVLPLVLPTALYLAWVRTTQPAEDAGAVRWRALPWLWLAVAGTALLVIVLFQLLLIVYRYVFASAPMSIYLVGDLVLLLGMATFSSAMLGEDAFKAFIERFIEKVG